MPQLFVFLLKVNVALLVFCAGYYLVLRHLTFYTLNRIYLVTAILFASVYPQINLSEFVQQHQQIAKPVQAVIVNFQAPASAFIKPLSQPNYWYWVEFVFWAGAAVFAFRLLVQLFSLLKIYRNSTAAHIMGHDVRIIKGDSGPFSFWKSIYVNPARHEPTDLTSILMHEQIHISEWHTLDILLAEISTIFYWFNPGIWLMKRAIRENIEFITDRKILNTGADTKQYQYSLLNVSFAAAPRGIVNHFNISTIKKRIIMMNAKRSSKAKLTRYALLIPGVIILLLVFSITKAAHTGNTMHKASAVITRYAAVLKNNIASVITKTGVTVNSTASKVTDTIRKGGFYLTTSKHSDSLNYVINGVKAGKAAFKALDPGNIYSIEIMPGTEAAKLIDKIDLKSNVLFITTNDSKAGKKFKEGIDKLNGRANIAGTSASASIAGSGSVNISDGDEPSVAVGSGESTSVTAIAGENSGSVSLNVPARIRLRPMKVRSMKGNINIITDSLTYNSKPMVLQITGDSLKTLTYTTKNMTYTIKPKLKTFAYKNKVYKSNLSYTPKAYTISAYGNDETNIEHLSSKLIIIDGKEADARDLKKLSAADIESMSVKTGDDMTEKYGDKAQNGVLFITTTKNKDK